MPESASFVVLIARRVLAVRSVPITAALLLMAGCGGEPAPGPPISTTSTDSQPPRASTPDTDTDADPAAAATGPLVIFLGDSLTAGFGLPGDQAFPAVVARRLAADGVPVRFVNAGVSGDTTAGGQRRLDWLLGQGPDVVVVGLGGNDGLRGLSLEQSEANLTDIVTRVRDAGATPLVLGMRIPTNYGPEYTEAFFAMYERVADAADAPRVPFLLEGVGGVPELNLDDGIHPNRAGHERIADLVVPHLTAVVASLPSDAVPDAAPADDPPAPPASAP